MVDRVHRTEDRREKCSTAYQLGPVPEGNALGQGKNNLKGFQVLTWLLGIQIAAGIVSVSGKRWENLEILVALGKVHIQVLSQ